MAALAGAEIIARKLGSGVPGAGPFVQHLTLWVGFLGAALAASEGKLLALATASFLPEGRGRRWAGIFASAVAAGVSALLARASLDMVLLEREFGSEVALGLPKWIASARLTLRIRVDRPAAGLEGG